MLVGQEEYRLVTGWAIVLREDVSRTRRIQVGHWMGDSSEGGY
jgi:hypothetical protein